ncbi:MAG: hypothetical protein IIC29_09730 [Chloroflexi bacterium]|nr:hypothetical protein [Chloroflexota bacterium]
MWITCLQENLSKGLGVVGRAVATRATLPVTQNVLLTTDQSRLKLTATNLEIAISTWIGAQIEREGSVTIPARLLTEFVNQLPDDKIEIDLTDSPKGISIQCARFKANMNGTDAEEFPPIPTVEDGTTVSVPADVLRGAIERVAFAAATEDSRPVLTGVEIGLGQLHPQSAALLRCGDVVERVGPVVDLLGEQQGHLRLAEGLLRVTRQAKPLHVAGHRTIKGLQRGAGSGGVGFDVLGNRVGGFVQPVEPLIGQQAGSPNPTRQMPGPAVLLCKSVQHLQRLGCLIDLR